MRGAVEESLRYDGSVQFTTRIALEDVELGDLRASAVDCLLPVLGRGQP